MSVKVSVENFQSIQKAEIEIDGLTVITGPNNSGKTALMRAVRGVFTNTGGVAFVRRGEEKSSVTVEFEDGNKVQWEKGAKIKPTYHVNDKKILPGRAVPQEVLDLSVCPIKAGADELWPQIATQIHGQVFLINKPGSTIAEAVADVERVGTLNGSMRMAEKDLRQNRSTLKIRRQDESDLAEELEGFAGLDEIGDKVTELEEDQKSLAKISKATVALQELRQRRDATEETIQDLKGIKDVEVPPVELAEELRGLRSKTEGLVDLKDRLEVAQTEVDALDGAEKLSDLEMDEGRLPKIWTAFKVVADLRKRRKSAKADLQDAQEGLELEEGQLKTAQESVDSLLIEKEAYDKAEAEAAAARAKAEIEAAAAKARAEAEAEIEAAAAKARAEAEAEAAVAAAEAKAAAEAALAAADKARAEAEAAAADHEHDLSDLDECPTCGAVLNG